MTRLPIPLEKRFTCGTKTPVKYGARHPDRCRVGGEDAGSFGMPLVRPDMSMRSQASTQQLEVFVAPHDAGENAMLTLTNTSTVPRRVSVFGYVEWCLGPPRSRRTALRRLRAG